jgi:hypothetical protein
VRPKPDPDPSDKIESDEWTMPEPELRFRVSGTFAEDGSITVTNVGQEMARGVHPGYPTDAELVLLDQSGRKLARGELTGHIGHMVLGPRRDAPLGGALDCRPFHSSGFSGSVRAVDGGVVLQIERGGEAIWTRRAPGPIPRIDSVRCEIDGNVGRISWSDDASKTDSYDAQPQVRRDSGGDWLAFQTRRPPAPPIGERDLVAGPVEFDIQDLPSGEGFLRMSVSDGFYCVFSEPIRVTVPPPSDLLPPVLGRGGNHTRRVGFGYSVRSRHAVARQRVRKAWTDDPGRGLSLADRRRAVRYRKHDPHRSDSSRSPSS